MLVVNRKAKQTMTIGGAIVIKILGIDGDNVRLGIDAPQELEIRRGEWDTDETLARQQSGGTRERIHKRGTGRGRNSPPARIDRSKHGGQQDHEDGR